MRMYKKLTYFENPAFIMEAEFVDKFAYIHLEVSKWTVSVAKSIYSVFKTFLEECRESGITAVYTLSPNPKFCQMYAGQHVGFVKVDSKEYEVYKWDLK